MFCPNCRRELPDGTKFCGGCGTPIAVNQTPTAPVQPEAPVKPVVPVRTSAPARPAAPAGGAPAAAPAKPDAKGILNKVTDTVKKIPSKYLKIGAAALVVLLVIILAVNIFGGDKVPNYALYVKDEQLYYSKVNGKEGSQVTEDLDSTYYSGSYQITQDGKKLFYIDDSSTLCYRNTSNMKKDPVELDTKVSRFWVSENGKLVTYLKNGTLYQHNLKKEEKIAKNVSSVVVSDDGKIIYYTNDDGDRICWRNGKEEEIADDIYIVYYSEDYKTIIYVDGDDVLSKKVGKKAKEITSDIAGSSGISQDGTFFYWLYPEADMSDYFDDKDLDGEMDYLCTLYYYNGSSSKKIADNVWVQETVDSDVGNHVGVYYTKFGKVAEGDLDYDDLQDKIDDDDMSYNEAMVELLTEVSGKSTEYIAINGKTAKVTFEEDVYSLYLSNDGKSMYAVVDVEDGEGTLLKAKVSGNKVKSFKEVDSNVQTDMIYGFIVNASYFGRDELMDENFSDYFVYMKDIKESHGELFVNGESVADDVYYSQIRYNVGENAVMYYVDREDGAGTLMMYTGKKSVEIASDVNDYIMHENGDIAFTTDADEKGATLSVYSGKVKEVADNVYDYYFTADGEILYLADYKNGEADLGMYDGKAKIIDEDVTQILDVYDCNDD